MDIELHLPWWVIVAWIGGLLLVFWMMYAMGWNAGHTMGLIDGEHGMRPPQDNWRY